MRGSRPTPRDGSLCAIADRQSGTPKITAIAERMDPVSFWQTALPRQTTMSVPLLNLETTRR